MSHSESYVDAMRECTLLTNKMVQDVEAIVDLVLEVENNYIMAGLKLTQATEYEIIGLRSTTSLPNYMLKRELVTLDSSVTDLKKTIEKTIMQAISGLKENALTEPDHSTSCMDPDCAKAFDDYRSEMMICTRVLEDLSKRLFDAEMMLNDAN